MRVCLPRMDGCEDDREEALEALRKLCRCKVFLKYALGVMSC